jgi:hypothetical protein
VAAPIHPADDGDTTTLPDTLEAAARNLAEVGLAPTPDEPCDVVGDKILCSGHQRSERVQNGLALIGCEGARHGIYTVGHHDHRGLAARAVCGN